MQLFRRKPTLVVNSGAAAAPMRVNLRAAVNAADIRTEMYNGREHLVLPSYTLPDNVVMNGGLYPADEIEKSYKSLEDTPAPMGHPQVNGEYVSAYHPAAINGYYAGAFNRNVRREGHRVYLEKWVDVEFAKTNAQGQALLAAIKDKQPIHTSTGVLLEPEPVTNASAGYKWIARNMRFDHDAILINETGAATPEQGVGLFVNVAEAQPLVVNDDVLSDDSYEAKRSALTEALQVKYGSGETWVYAEDFDGVNVIYCVDGDYFTTGYSYIDGRVTLSEQSAPVERKVEFSLKSVVNKILNMLRPDVVSKPAILTNSEAIDMKPEELQAMLDASAQKSQEATVAAINAAVEPLKTELAAVTAANEQLQAQLKANTDAAEADMRAAVAAEYGEHGELVANSLTGEALKAAFAKCAKAAPLVGGYRASNRQDDGLDATLPE